MENQKDMETENLQSAQETEARREMTQVPQEEAEAPRTEEKTTEMPADTAQETPEAAEAVETAEEIPAKAADDGAELPRPEETDPEKPAEDDPKAPEGMAPPAAPQALAGLQPPQAPAAPEGRWNKQTKIRVATGVALVSAVLVCLILLGNVLLNAGSPGNAMQSSPTKVGIMDRFDMNMTNQISNALDGVLSVEKSYWLNDDDLIAPEPDQECYGETDDPSSLQWLLDDARERLGVEATTFSLDLEIQPGSKVLYYLDDTIFVITWKQILENCIYTFSEVKIAHPSQFRRFLAGGEYGSDKQFITTEMAATVNAVMASSGDFYKYRSYGIIVYDGVVQRCNGWAVDTCFIDDKGDLHFAYAGQITSMEQAQKYVDENNIRFSLAFGPVLVDNYKRCNPHEYLLGEIDDRFPRAALCQKDDLHYVVIVSNHEGEYWQTPKLWEFAYRVETYGFEKAYTLDGGQTAVIAMNDKLINSVHFGYQRQISDIFYFATAIPSGG